MTEKHKTKFDKLYDGSKELIKSMRKPLARKSIKRKIRSGYDDAQTKIDDLLEKNEDIVIDIKNIDLNRIVNNMADIEEYQKAQRNLSKLWKDLFGEDFNPEIE